MSKFAFGLQHHQTVPQSSFHLTASIRCSMCRIWEYWCQIPHIHGITKMKTVSTFLAWELIRFYRKKKLCRSPWFWKTNSFCIKMNKLSATNTNHKIHLITKRIFIKNTRNPTTKFENTKPPFGCWENREEKTKIWVAGNRRPTFQVWNFNPFSLPVSPRHQTEHKEKTIERHKNGKVKGKTYSDGKRGIQSNCTEQMEESHRADRTRECYLKVGGCWVEREKTGKCGFSEPYWTDTGRADNPIRNSSRCARDIRFSKRGLSLLGL